MGLILCIIDTYLLIVVIYLENIIIRLEELVWSEPLVLLLIFTHIYLTFKLKNPQKYTLKGLKLILKNDENKEKKGINSFKSLMTILAATLGTGNIIGIATAIAIGGIGSIFWIFITGIFAIATKYAETYIVLKYRRENQTGYYGGAMYVLNDKLKFKTLAILFSIFTIIASFGIGSMIQSNAMSNSLIETFNVNKYIIAIIVTIICSYVIFGNEKRISNISSILVPIATLLYLFMCIYVLFIYKHNIASSIINIINEALNFKSVSGGIIGSIAIKAMNVGMSKGLFSNEAGMGSSPIFNATVKMKSMKNESIISSTSVFIDTVILCTITGIAIVSSGMYVVTNNPIELINETFKIIPYGKELLTFSIAIFAIATIPCWGYYGKCAVRFLFKENKKYEKIYDFIYAVCIYIGAIMTVNIVWGISSIANALMIIPNLVMIYKLKNEIK